MTQNTAKDIVLQLQEGLELTGALALALVTARDAYEGKSEGNPDALFNTALYIADKIVKINIEERLALIPTLLAEIEPDDLPEIPESASPKLKAVTRAIQEWTGGEYGLKTAMIAIEAYETIVKEKPVSLKRMVDRIKDEYMLEFDSIEKIVKEILKLTNVKYEEE